MQTNTQKRNSLLLKEAYPEIFHEIDLTKSMLSGKGRDKLNVNSYRRLWWTCSNCQHSFNEMIYNRVNDFGDCPNCSKKPRMITPSLPTTEKTTPSLEVVSSAPSSPVKPSPRKKLFLVETHPHLVAEWHPTKNGSLDIHQLTSGSGKYAWWKCQNENCQHEWSARIANRCKNNSQCPICAHKRRLETVKENKVKKKNSPLASISLKTPSTPPVIQDQPLTVGPTPNPQSAPMELDCVWNFRTLEAKNYLVFNGYAYQVENNRGKRLIDLETLAFIYDLFKNTQESKGKSIPKLLEAHEEVLTHLGFDQIKQIKAGETEGEYLVKIENSSTSTALYLKQNFKIFLSRTQSLDDILVEDVLKTTKEYYQTKVTKLIEQKRKELEALEQL